jgi:Homeodomain-like domain
MVAERLPKTDPTLDSLNEFADTIEDSAAEQRALAKRARRLSRTRARGKPWSEVVASDGNPALPAESTQLLARLAAANTRVRQSLARALRSEGLGIEQIARLFGVTHQRVSRILSQSSD